MMKMSRGVTVCCLFAFLALRCGSAYQRLNSIKDLKKIDFGQSVPKHSLVLLHWFANTVYSDNNDVIWLTFEPDRGDYGSHHYGNYERLLDPLPLGNVRYRYFTVGNLNQGTATQLPDYVLHPPVEYMGTNRDRIIFRVREEHAASQAWHRIDQVYITQHYAPSEGQGTRYDPCHTYRITTNLLRQLRQFSVEENRNSLSELRDDFGSNISDSELRDLRNTWKDLACLGLMLFIVVQEKYLNRPSNQPSNRPSNRPNDRLSNRPQHVARRETQNDFIVNIQDDWQSQRDEVLLDVTTGKNGNARIIWRNISRYRLQEGVMVVLFKNNNDQTASKTHKVIADSEGIYDTSVPLNEGFQARLHKARKKFCFWTVVGEEICRGPEFHSPDKVMITGYNACLQLFVKDGKACARLYVKKMFNNWKSEFNKSWVGFYSSANKYTDEYEFWRWQWATKFNQCTDSRNSSYDIFEYHSGMTIAPGVQARFIFRDSIVIACTPSWSS